MMRAVYPPQPVSYSHARDRTAVMRANAQPLAQGWSALAIIGTSLGVLGQAWYSYQGRVSGSSSPAEFYVSLSLVFVPPTLIILNRRASKNARIGFLLYMSLALIATRFMLYPTMFEYHDEIVHEWNVITIDKTSHLFASNAILPVTPYYPGLEIATSAVEHLTGLPLHSAGTVVLFLSRIVMTLGLLLVFQKVSGNSFISTLATLLYTLNPQYLLFNSEFSYQTVALPMCFFCIYLFSVRSRRLGIWGIAPSVAVAAVIAVSHHLTSVALVVTLWTWYLYTRMNKRREPDLALFATLSTLVVAAWTWVARKELIPYISGIVQQSVGGIDGLLSGLLGHKLFTDAAGDKEPDWQVLLALASVLLACLALAPAVWYAYRNRRSLSPAALTLATVAVLYPIVPAGQLAAATGEVAERASGFIFVGLAFAFASWWYSPGIQRVYRAASKQLSDLRRRYRPAVRFRMRRRVWLLALAAALGFAGGVVDGSGPDWGYGPGSYLVSADNRSVDQLALQAAYWEGQHLPAGSRVYTDRVNGLLAQTYGGVAPLTPQTSGVPQGILSYLLLAPASTFDPEIACLGGVQYLIADQRLSTGLPHVGIYIDNGEYLQSTRTAPPAASDLTKFDQVPGAQRIFDNGAIRIYNLKGLACQS